MIDMSQVIVMYEDGRVWSCEVDGVGDGDAGEICAASVSVGIVGGSLVFEPAVMPWKDGTWRSPTGIIDQWTNSNRGFVDVSGGRHEFRSGGSAYSEHGTVEESYTQKRYVLRTARQLEGAMSVTVDGMLAYSREDGKLVPVIGSGNDGDGGMTQNFAVDNRPMMADPFEGAPRATTGIRYEVEVM